MTTQTLNKTLSRRQRLDLLDTLLTPLHHHMFIRKWIDVDPMPKHIYLILDRLWHMPKEEKKKFYFVGDAIYYCDTTPQAWVKHETRGWIKAKKYTISRQK